MLYAGARASIRKGFRLMFELCASTSFPTVFRRRSRRRSVWSAIASNCFFGILLFSRRLEMLLIASSPLVVGGHTGEWRRQLGPLVRAPRTEGRSIPLPSAPCRCEGRVGNSSLAFPPNNGRWSAVNARASDSRARSSRRRKQQFAPLGRRRRLCTGAQREGGRAYGTATP